MDVGRVSLSQTNHSKNYFLRGTITSIDRSDQTAVSGKHLDLLPIFLARRPGFPPLDAVPLRATFVRPEIEVKA
jgi:hypothetical protein